MRNEVPDGFKPCKNATARIVRVGSIGADTCDGSGIARYDHMLETLLREISSDGHPLFESTEAVA